MKTIGKNMLQLATLSLMLFMSQGCSLFRSPVEVVIPPNLTPIEIIIPQKPAVNNPDIVRRFEQTGPDGQTALDTAIELSKKYSQLTEEVVKLRQENETLYTENQQMKPQLTQTLKELTEANELLIEMRVELNNWKSSILGFRNEMRSADKAQLNALLRILSALGGESPTESDLYKPLSVDQSPQYDPDQQESLQAKIITGKNNE